MEGADHQGWIVKLREPHLGPASAQHSLRVVSKVICYPIKDRAMAPVEPQELECPHLPSG